MKIRTNLSPSELSKVSKGIAKLANDHVGDSFVANNEAESKLDAKILEAYDVMTVSLLKTITKIIKE